MDCVPNELMSVIDGVIVVQFQMTYGCNMYVWSHIHIARVWTNRIRLPVLHVVSWTENKYEKIVFRLLLQRA